VFQGQPEPATQHPNGAERQAIRNERTAVISIHLHLRCGCRAQEAATPEEFPSAARTSVGAREVRRTYNGYTITVENAIALEMPELEVGWTGLSLEATRCKNFRLGVAQFGWTVQPDQPEIGG